MQSVTWTNHVTCGHLDENHSFHHVQINGFAFATVKNQICGGVVAVLMWGDDCEKLIDFILSIYFKALHTTIRMYLKTSNILIYG